jgi:hypothetical protein
MLAVLGAALIGAALLVLLGLVLVSRAARWHWLARAELAERITTGLVACFAVGMGCIELNRRVVPGDGPSAVEVTMLLATLLGFALLWWWFRLSEQVGPRPTDATITGPETGLKGG